MNHRLTKTTLVILVLLNAVNFTFSQAKDLPAPTHAGIDKWTTVGLTQANSMGAGEAAIPKKEEMMMVK